jgi:hypothetical protein
MSAITPRDVFVPGKFPIQQSNAYADRGSTQQDLQIALSRGFVPLVFGSYGVGKSSLAMRCAAAWQANSKLVYIPTVYRQSLRSILERILEHLGYEVTIQRVTHGGRKGKGETGFEAAGSALTILKATLKGTISREWEHRREDHHELVVKSPSDASVVEICEEHGILLMIDELHRATAGFSRDLSAFLKAYANMSCDKSRICLIGTEDDASGLVIMDPGVDRVLQEIPVKPLTSAEAKSVILSGMSRLGIEAPGAIVDRVIRASVGSAFILQYLCLEMAERARGENARTLTENHFSNALETYVRRKAQRAIRAYKAAIETIGPKRFRKQILLAMAQSDDEYVTMDELVRRVSEQLGEPVPSSTLSGPLRELKEARYGRILKDVDDPMGISRIYNYSAFSDPATKSVIRLLEELDLEESHG